MQQRPIDFVFLPDGEDPVRSFVRSFVRVHRLEGFQAAPQGALPLQDFLIEHVSSSCDMQYAEGRSLCTHCAKPLWFAPPDGSIRAGLLDYCATLLRFTTDKLLNMWHRQILGVPRLGGRVGLWCCALSRLRRLARLGGRLSIPDASAP